MRATFDRGAKIRRWEKNLSDPKAALKQIGILMVSESSRAFSDQKFGSTKWKERAVPNVFGLLSDFRLGRTPPARRFESRPVLRDTGRLANTIAYEIVSSDTVEVGTKVPYAAAHQFGLPVESEKITETVQKRLAEWLTGGGKKWKKRLGYLTNAKFRDQTLKAQMPKRPFLGVTRETIRSVKEVVGVKIMETR